MKSPGAKILVIRGGAIGDFVLTLPVLSALKRTFPQCHLEVLGYPHIAQLALIGSVADDVRSIEARPLAGFFAPHGRLDEAQAGYFAQFAVIVSYLFDLDGTFQANVARSSKAQFIAGPHRPDESQAIHATEVFLKPLERLAIFGADPVPRLELVSLTDVAMPPGRWLAVHPGSGSDKKNWPESKWLELLPSLLASEKLNLLLVGGEAEGERLERLSARIPANRFKVARDLPLATLAHWLKQCIGLIGHDSGISHLAAALGLPTLVLWGTGHESIWRPRGERVSILRHPNGLPHLTVGEVIAKLPVVLGPAG